MDNIIVSSFLCIFSLVIGVLSLYESELFTKKQTRKLMLLALVVIFEISIDSIALSLNGNIQYLFEYKALKVLEFTLTPIIPTLIASLIARKRFWQKIRKYFIVLITANTICEVITFFTPLMFYIDDGAIYNRTAFTNLYIVYIIVCFFLSMVCSYKSFVQNTYGISITILATNIFLLSGWLIRAYNLNSNADWICITLGYFLFIIDFSNSYLKIDSLTSLLNRRSFNNKISSSRYTTAIIIIDADNFKSINDTYGHQCGDWALATIAETIFNVYGNIGYCYRIGGDEFCVILKPGILKKLTAEEENMDCYEALKNRMNLLDTTIKNLSEKRLALKYGVSQGFGIYYSIQDNPDFDEHKTMRDVYRIADERMYMVKKQKKISES